MSKTRHLMRMLNLAIITALICHVAFAQSPAAKVTSTPPTEEYKTEASDAEKRKEAFEIVWQTVRDYHFDPNFGGVDWNAVREEFAPRVTRAQNDWELHRLLQEMLNRLGQSHFVVVPPESIPAMPPEEPDSPEPGSEPEDEDPPPPSSKGLGVTEQLTHGIGIDLRIINAAVVITRVEPISAAERAGLRPGFVVRSVDGQRMSRILRLMKRAAAYQPSVLHQIPAELIFGFFNGPPGTYVRIVYLDARNHLHRIRLKREKLKGEMSPPINSFPAQFVEFESRRLKQGIGYIRFNLFVPQVMEKFCMALRSMKDAPGIIIDLRGNRGGVLSLLHGMGGLLDKRPVSFGTLRARSGSVEFTVFPQKNPYTGQLVILIDETSQSAGEIFAAGLKESGRALIIGDQSAGSTLPSVAKELPTGAILQYAFADFRTRSGNRIEGQGVRPDIPVKLERRALLGGRDPQLEAAVDAVQPPVTSDASTNASAARDPADSTEPSEEVERQGDGESLKVGEVAALDPVVERIIERYVQAIGGREAVEKISSRMFKGTFEGSFLGIKVRGTVEILEKAPSKAISLITIPSMGVMRRGFTGSYGYEQFPTLGFRELSGAELANARLSSDFYWGISLKRLYPKMVLKGKEKVGGSDAYVVEATPTRGSSTTLYFDVKTGLLSRKDEAYFEDYREVDSVVMPFTVRSGNTVIALTEVKFNLPVDNAKFAEQKDCFTQ